MNASALNLYAAFLGATAEKVVAALMRLQAVFLQRKGRRRLALIGLCIGCGVAFGQLGGTPTPRVNTNTPNTYSFNADSIISQISTAVMSQLTSLQNNSQLQAFGSLVTAFFLVAMLVWTAVKSLAGGRGLGELVGEWIPVFVAFGIVTLFLDRNAGSMIVSTMDAIGAAVGGANMSTLESAIRASAEPIFRAIAAVVDQPRVTSASSAGGWGALDLISTFVASAGSMVMGALAKVITVFLLVVAGTIVIAHTILAFISIQFVLALAPVMVPFLMFKPMAWLFDSWLRFLLGACMLKIVLAFLLNVGAGLLAAMSNLALIHYNEARNASAIETLQTDIVLLGMMIIFALLATLLIHQAPSIATGLLSGSAGGIGFSGMKGVTQGASGRVGGSALPQVTTRPTAAAGGAFRNWAAGKRGASHAKAGMDKDLRYRPPAARAAYDRGYRNARPKTETT